MVKGIILSHNHFLSTADIDARSELCGLVRDTPQVDHRAVVGIFQLFDTLYGGGRVGSEILAVPWQ